jgi:4-hydroxybenzoate polyprenyltransferase
MSAITLKTLGARIDAYEKLVRLDKPIGILLLLWPTLWAIWIASRRHPNEWLVWFFILGTILMRSAGCAVNDWADRKYDREVARTRDRPLAAGTIAPWEALVVAAVLALGALALVLQFNNFTILLSVIGVALSILYPFTKRFFTLPQAWLGLAFSFGIPMAFAAQLDVLPPICWALVAANFCWVMAYDTEYAMVDRDDDRRIGIRTSAILFGRFDVAIVMLCYALFLGGMAAIGFWIHYGAIYFASVAVSTGIAVYHYTLIRGRSREGCFKAFLHNNWIGAASFAGIVADGMNWSKILG